MSEPTRADLENAARTHFTRLAADLDRPRDIPSDPAEYQHSEAYRDHLREERLTALKSQLAANQYDGNVELNARAISSLLGLDYDQLDQQKLVQISHLAVRAEVAQAELYRHQLTSPLESFEPTDKLFGILAGAPTQDATASAGTVGPTHSLKKLTETYIATKRAKGITEHQIAEISRVFRWLLEVAGTDVAAAGVTRQLLRGFRTDLARIDVRLRGRKLPFKARLTDELEERIKYQTAVRYWNATQAFFAWSASEGFIDASPSIGLAMDKPKVVIQRSPPSFTTDELVALFETPLFSGYKPKHQTTPGDCLGRDGRWWYVVLAMHSGSRAGELCQLLPGDFVFDDEVPHWKIRTEDADGKQTKAVKNLASIRDVPIHPRLMDLGLREFVEGRAKRFPKGRLFMELREGTGGRHSAGASRFFTDYLKTFNLHKPGRSTHVWRHTFTDCLRRNGIVNDDIGALLGHSPNTQTAKYGSDHPLARKSQTMLQLDYGFDVLAALGGPYNPSRHRV